MNRDGRRSWRHDFRSCLAGPKHRVWHEAGFQSCSTCSARINRPVQITDDLNSFWKTTYHQVRKDLRGRYPKHAWPEEPLRANRLPERSRIDKLELYHLFVIKVLMD